MSGDVGRPMGGHVGVDASAVLEWVRGERQAFVSFLSDLARMESPTDEPATQAPVQAYLTAALEELGYRVRHHPGRETGGILLASPRTRTKGRPLQLMVGHTDTVWPVGTLKGMPVRLDGDRLAGPGTFDMKAGLTQMIFALRAVRAVGAEPPATPVLLLNSDEETGSPESGRWVRRLASRACRAFVPEPSWGEAGLLKTARKGVGQFAVTIHGKAAHAGLDPAAGASAITELSSVIRRLHGLTDMEAGTTVNVGVVSGGTRSNVVAASARADVDVRVVSMEEGRRVEAAILGLEAETPGVRVEVTGGMVIPPLERTPRNRALWVQAENAAAALGHPLGETMVGGASDGSVISQYAATLDGMGAVGDGAHADHEHVLVQQTLERSAFLALLLLAPMEPFLEESR